ncbi:MAG: [protein-PII] uridylyltransferase [Thiotrichaceae bacterium]|nr:[protein-PII] uridylyltransferase [Thiotrichaceae bacterium]PCI14520.1 MAG: [protein-PII] uridylyltransferase [Thiotrichales bacterium]
MLSHQITEIEHAFEANATLLKTCRATTKQVIEVLREHLERNTPITTLIHARANFTDRLLQLAWQHFMPADNHGIALIAVGGYGRGELHPCSDVDVLLLLAQENHHDYQEALSTLITFFWDIGLEIGHSTRTIDECVDEATRDITVITNLIETRHLAGPNKLLAILLRRTEPDKVWSSAAFFEAKEEEQRRRHLKYHDAAYNLEPNVKEGPGGLRDLQMISWVTRRYFNSESLDALVTQQFLTHEEYDSLIKARDFLWRVRFVLHLHTKRSEERLLFDHQEHVAKAFGHRNQSANQAIEAFMKDYYIHIMEVSRLNEMLLQHFREEILSNHNSIPVAINDRFQITEAYLEVTGDDVFEKHPPALLELFLILTQRADIKGVRAATIRLVRSHRHLIDDDFRSNPECRENFITLLRQSHGITHQLRRMNRYGLLAAYIPAFGNIVGQMQHDMFHVYTVDEHTLNVLRNVRRFTVPLFRDEFPNCSKIIQPLKKLELLYLGALFHDIAKGRGGDHSQLGKEDAYVFCQQHGLSEQDSNIVAWLVQSHLIMSVTAQRRDISDPDVIAEFAAIVKTQTHLDYLYLLTVADIRGTDPKLWNNWKDSLLFNLYNSTKQALRCGLDQQVDKSELVIDRQKESLALLTQHERRQIGALWQQFDDDYFLRHSAAEIAWHSTKILAGDATSAPLIAIHSDNEQGGTKIFIYTNDKDNLFANTAIALDQLNLNIIDARIITAKNGFTLNTYIVLGHDHHPVHEIARIGDIIATLKRIITQDEISPIPATRRLSRRQKHFKTATRLNFFSESNSSITVMELNTNDRPGLLSRIGKVLMECGIKVHNAKIGTFGERAEDIFYISNKDDHAISDVAQLEQLRAALIAALEK